MGSNDTGGTGNVANTGGSGGQLAGTGGIAVSTPGGASPVLPAGGAAGVGGSSNYCNSPINPICMINQFVASDSVQNMLLVIDESGSMSNRVSSTNASSKWSELRTALSATLPQLQGINFGLELFPYSASGPIDSTATDPGTYCQVPADSTAIAVEINTDSSARASNLQRILDTVDSAVPAGGTPTAAALDQAYRYFTQGNGVNLVGSKSILLATDGGPNCNSSLNCSMDTCTQNLDLMCAGDPNTTVNCCENAGYGCLDSEAVVARLRTLAAIGVNTYVVGLPGSEAYAAALDTFALAGNTPNPSSTTGHSYYGVAASNSLADLEVALTTITSVRIRSCDMALAEAPPDPSKVNVFVDCSPVPRFQNGTTPDGGWTIDYSYSPPHLTLVGAPCTQIASVGAQRVDIVGGCLIN